MAVKEFPAREEMGPSARAQSREEAALAGMCACVSEVHLGAGEVREGFSEEVMGAQERGGSLTLP